MEVILNLIQGAIFIILSALHFHWAFGGDLWFNDVIPTDMEGKNVHNPGKIESAVVGVGLLLFSSFYLIQMGYLDLSMPRWVSQYGGWIISTIFLLRAIGDFKYVGFAKKIKSTEFAKNDTSVYSPLCLAISINGTILAW